MLAGMLTLALALSPAAAWAQAPSLYGAGVAESAILVRLVNASSGGAHSLQIGAQTLEAEAFGAASAYKPVAADIYTLFYGGKRYEFLPETKSYYTIVALDSGLAILKDTRHADPARAQLYFYNMSDGAAADLKTADGSLTVLPAVAARSSAQAAVNPISLKLAAFRGGVRAGGEHALSMARGSSYALFLALKNGAAQSFIVTATVQAD
jgi:alginate O-acetyltransferase complex protein AlgF